MRVLVTSASKHGGTEGIGRTIARILGEAGFEVEVAQPGDVHDLDRFGAVVIGSALYMGSWLNDAEHLVDEHGDQLRRKPCWLFSSGPLGPSKPEEPIDPEVLDALLERTAARDHRLFGGRLALERLSRRERFIARWVGASDGDYRQWDEIERWATEIAAELEADPEVEEYRSSLRRLIGAIDAHEADEPALGELRAAADKQLVEPDHSEQRRDLAGRVKHAVEMFETELVALVRAINDVSYYLSGMGL